MVPKVPFLRVPAETGLNPRKWRKVCPDVQGQR